MSKQLKKQIGANAFAMTMARKQALGTEAANQVELMCRLHFDAAKRGYGTADVRDSLAKNTLIAALMCKTMRLPNLENYAFNAYNVICYANSRDSNALRFTTGESMIMLNFFNKFFKLLPKFELGIVSDCSHQAEKEINRERRMAA